MKLRALALAIGLLATTTACTPQSDVVVDQVLALKLPGFTLQTPNPKAACQPLELFCSEPTWTINFSGPSNLKPDDVCHEVISAQQKLGLSGYSNFGYPLGEIPADISIVEKFCVEGIGKTLTISDGSKTYLTLHLTGDGSNDGMQKSTELGRSATGEYFLNYSLTRRNQGDTLVGSDSVPTHPSQMEQDETNASIALAAKTQAFANTLIGLKEKDAIAAIEKAGYQWRVTIRGTEELITPTTDDYSPTRIGLWIQGGLVHDALTN